MRTILTIFTLATLSTTAGFAADAKAGMAVYNKACKSCHGADGTANPAIAKMFKVDMKALSSADVQATSDADMKAIIANGKGKMKPVSSVTGASVDDVVAYVRSLKK
jgi:mono/diheme cytochrome c family protein